MTNLSEVAYDINEAIRGNLKLTVLVYALILGWWPVRNMDFSTWFTYHPTSMTFAFVGLSYVGILYKQMGGYQNTLIHGYFMTFGCLLALFGIWAIYTNKIILEKEHFTTKHGFYGIIAFLGYIFIEIVGGLLLHPNFGLMKTHKYIRKAHKYFGLIVQSLCWYSVVSGFTKLESNENIRIALLSPLFLVVMKLWIQFIYPQEK